MRKLRLFPKRLLLWMIRFYRANISPLHPGCCRYIPTCSQYALEAVEKYGALKGGYLALRRILRCHPFHAGGYDPFQSPEASETRCVMSRGQCVVRRGIFLYLPFYRGETSKGVLYALRQSSGE